MNTKNNTFGLNSDVTVVLTSCNRLDLLKQTLDSFFSHCSYPIKQFILIKDSAKVSFDEVKHCFGNNWHNEITIIINEKPLGQLKSIDKAYANVQTKYVFHCEDDWLFYRSDFIEDSKKILEDNRNIFSVWLRSYYHDLVDYSGSSDIYLGKKQNIEHIVFYKICSKRDNNQCFSLNPGLRYYKHYPKQGYISLLKGDLTQLEDIASSFYESSGLYSVLLENSVVKHIGFNNHVRDWTKRWKKIRSRLLRLVIIIIVFLLGFWLG